MTRFKRAIVYTALVIAAIACAACDEGGIGMSVPSSGARWSGPGPDVMMAGGPR